MRVKWGLILVVITGFSGFLRSQPTSYTFRSPLDIELKLSGTFGELRPNHFHMGIDIKTFGEGKKVYATADGCLARIKISQYGYGKALYLNHAEGYTTLYAHLSKFNYALEKFVREQQYKMKVEEIDIAVPDSLINFKKGDVIAYSGNTGSSEGAHLHYEIRETKTDIAINPLLCKIPVADTRAPDVYGIKVYQIGANARINGKPNASIISFKKNKNGVVIESTLRCTAVGKIAFGVFANDYMNGSGNRNGIYEIVIKKNDEDFFTQKLDKIDFATTRFINTYMDYDEYHGHSKHIHKCYTYGNNKLEVYGNNSNHGFLTILPNDSLMFTFLIKDGCENTKKVTLKIIGEPESYDIPFLENCTYKLHYNDSLNYKMDNFRLYMDKGTVYDSSCIQISESVSVNHNFSNEYSISGGGSPLQEYYSLSIKLPEKSKTQIEKLLIGVKRGDGWRYNKSLELNGFVSTQVREWGTFALVADTVSPTIQVGYYTDSMIFNGNKQLTFTIRDNFGIEKVNAYIDGEWVLIPYDKKKGKHILNASEPQKKAGYREIEVIAIDVRDNKTTWKGIIKTQ